MSLFRRPKSLALLLVLLAGTLSLSGPQRALCAPDNGGLTLPQGFCAVVLASGLDGVRHLAVGPSGDLYAAVSNGGDGKGVLGIRDRDGKPVEQVAFGPSGGNDVAVHGGYLYLARDNQVLRWRLTPGKLAPEGKEEIIVDGLPTGGHSAKTIAFGAGDAMYLKIGSATNSCQAADRKAGSPGQDPCTELERRAGIWQFSASRTGQGLKDAKRIATGLRNAEAITIQPGTGDLYAAIHGRDQLADSWGFSDEISAENPAEELVRVQPGDNFGWPYCYYSNQYRKKVLAPEYGGDGRKVGRCAAAKDPIMAFPGHWAPMALAFYSGETFGAAYHGGLFIAFHGSWNRAPLPQAGFRVVFAPFADGKAKGSYATFATGPTPTDLRATGLAVGTDGSLYLSADKNGKIWKISKK
ncbi:MAG TPA: PQQ-dependent sugar dehydrogenase [Gemmatimonadales bacterium]